MVMKRYRIVMRRNYYVVQKLHWLFYIIPYWFTWSESDGESYYLYQYKTIEDAEKAIHACNSYQKKSGIVKRINIS